MYPVESSDGLVANDIEKVAMNHDKYKLPGLLGSCDTDVSTNNTTLNSCI